VWDVWQQLCLARGGNGFGPNPIGWVELDAWQRLTGQNLTSWECETVVILDRAARAALTKD
jgi:hypothetical protein